MIYRIYFIWILMITLVQAQTSSLVTIQATGARSERINIVILSEGYTNEEMPKFRSDLQDIINLLFSKEPWSHYKSYCNVYGIEIASIESGCDNGDTGGPGVSRNTYFDSGFSYGDRLLTITRLDKALDLLNQHVPEFNVPCVLVNDQKYGGSGGWFTVVSTNSASGCILEHELGHSFADLADEYESDQGYITASERANNTSQTNRELIKWKDWIDPNTPLPTPEEYDKYDNIVGLFEGSMYQPQGWFRPHYQSMMRSLGQYCGQINREQFVLKYYDLVSTYDDFYPITTNATITAPTALTFSVTPKVPTAGPPLQIIWKVNGINQIGQNVTTFSMVSDLLGNGIKEVSVTLIDPTPFVRLDPSGILTDTIKWTFNTSGQIPYTMEEWRAAYGGDSTILTNDGLNNIQKYALGIPSDIAATELQTPITKLKDNFLTITIPRRLRRSDINYLVEVSSDNQNWSSGSLHTIIKEDSDKLLVVQDKKSSITEQRYIRFNPRIIPAPINDTKAPDLLTLEIFPSQYHPGLDGSTISVRARITDDLAGNAGAGYSGYPSQIRFRSPSSMTAIDAILDEYSRINGSSLDGNYYYQMVMPENAEVGTWVIESVLLVDQIGNSKQETVQDLAGRSLPTSFVVAVSTPSQNTGSVSGSGGSSPAPSGGGGGQIKKPKKAGQSASSGKKSVSSKKSRGKKSKKQ